MYKDVKPLGRRRLTSIFECVDATQNLLGILPPNFIVKIILLLFTNNIASSSYVVLRRLSMCEKN